MVVGDAVFFEVAESLNDKARGTPSGRHVLRCSAAKLNLLVSHCHVFFGTVGKIHDLGRHLLGQPEEVDRLGTGRLKTSVVLFADGLSNGVWLWAKQAELGVLLGVVIEPEGKAADCPGSR